MSAHPSLTIDQIGRCGAARIPVPPKEAVRSMDALGIVKFDLSDPEAQWRFRTPMDIAKGEPPVTLVCFPPDRVKIISQIEKAL